MADEEFRACRRCLLWESGEGDVLEDIKKHIEKIPPRDKSPEEVYRFRLGVCLSCDDLVGGVCMKCGCYPEFRAAFTKNKCPAKKWSLP